MAQTNPRELIAHAVIVSGIVFGAAAMLIAPRLEEQASRHAQLAAAQAEAQAIAERARLQHEAQGVIKQVSRIEEAIETRSAQASDEIALHRAYHDAADRYGLSIERFDPSPINRAPSRRRGDKKGPELPSPQFASTVRIDATGTLDAVIEFVEFISGHAGFVKFESLRITPDSETVASGVRLSLETEHYSFAIPDPESMASADPSADGEGL
jgi:hypothetical protein